MVIILLSGCPTIDKPPKLNIPDKTVDEGQVLQFDLKQYADDKDKNTLVFTIVSGVGEIVGSDYRYAPTFDDSSEKEVKIRVTNSKGKSAEDTFKITVKDVNANWTIEITGTDSGSSFVIIEYDIIPERQPNMIVVVNRSLNNVDFSKLYTLSSDSTRTVDTNVLPDKTYFYDLQLLSNDELLDNAKTSVETAQEDEVTYETSEFTGNVVLPEGIDPTTLVVRNMDKVAPLDNQGNFKIDVKGDQVSVMFCSVPGYKIPLMTVVSPEVNGMQPQSTQTINKETTAKSLLMLNPFMATPFPDSMAKVNEAIDACSYLQTIADLIERLNNGESEVENELIGAIESALDEIIEYLNEHYAMEKIDPSVASPVQITLPLVAAQGIGVRETIDVDLERVELSYTLEEIGGKTYYRVTPKIPGNWISVNSVVMLSEMRETLTVEEMETFEHNRSIDTYITDWPQIGVAQSETLYGWIDFIGKLINLGIDALFDCFLGEGKTSELLIPAWEDGNYAFSSYGGFADTSEFGIFIEDLWETFQDMKEGEDIVYSALPNELASFFAMAALNGLDVGLTVVSTIFNIRGLTEGEFIADMGKAVPEALRKGVLAAGFEYKGDLQDISKWEKFMKEYIKTISVESFRVLSKVEIKMGVGLIIDAGKEFLSYLTIFPKVMSIASNASEVLARITSMVGFVSPRELAFITVSQDNKLPVVTKVSGPSEEVSESSSTFTWTGSDSDGTITKFEYRKDEGNWVSNGTSTSYTWSGYSEGDHKFEVRAQDNEGDYSNIISWSFTYSTGTIVVGEMVLVEGGTFMMGDEFRNLWYGCRPVHQVTLTYDFYIGKYEVTFDEYDAFCDATGRSKPSDWGWGRGTRPVIKVSWWDAIAYCNWLSKNEGLSKAYDSQGNLLDKNGRIAVDISYVEGYRLPTEAEWEYAARGGKQSKGYKYSGSDDVDEVAWYYSNSGNKTQEVGNKAPNELGIYDMSGNVWEWCSDWYVSYSSSAQTNPYNYTPGWGRVYRGGGWLSSATGVRVAYRVNYSPTVAYNDLGFRITRRVP